MERQPLPGDFYRHYEGDTVQVLGIAEGGTDSGRLPTFTRAKISDATDERILVAIDPSGNLRYQAGGLFDGSLVVFSCSGDDWVLPKDEFLEVVAPRDSSFGTLIYRFQLI